MNVTPENAPQRGLNVVRRHPVAGAAVAVTTLASVAGVTVSTLPSDPQPENTAAALNHEVKADDREERASRSDAQDAERAAKKAAREAAAERAEKARREAVRKAEARAAAEREAAEEAAELAATKAASEQARLIAEAEAKA